MTRSVFAGRPGDTVASLFTIGNRRLIGLPVDANGNPTNAVLTIWDEPDGTQLTNLRAADGTTPITQVVVPSATGQIPEFYGPDGVNVYVYAKDSDGDYQRLDARADVAAASAAAAAERAEAAAAGVPSMWQPLTGYTAGSIRVAPDGSTLSRLADGTSRATFDATEKARWEPVLGKTGTIDQATLLASYVAAKNPPKVQGSKNGILYDGSDESTAMQALINACCAFGVGVLELEAIARCDSQLTIPTTGTTQPRQAPLRITGTVQYMPGSTFTDVTPYPLAAGLDLRYAGRTDAGCTITKGSVVVANPNAVASDRGNIVKSGNGISDWCYILDSQTGVGWTLLRPARATGTVSLTSFGGRIQSFGYGTLEIDHIQMLNRGTASSAPFLITTATKIDIHHNLVIGHSTKSKSTCDEDILLGGPGQGTRLTSALTSGTTYTSLPVGAVPCPLIAGLPIIIGANTANAQTVTIASTVAAGATSIPVTSFVAAANHAASDSVYFQDSQAAVGTGVWNVASGLFQGYGSRVHDNQFFRFRRVAQGGFASSVHVDHNAWMHNCGSTNSQVPFALTSALVSGTTYTALAVTAISRDVIAGDTIQIGFGDTSQEFIASADAAAGATSISVTSVAAVADFASGVKGINVSAGTGASIESHGAGGSGNSMKIDGNRIGFSGDYNYATRFTGATVSATIIGNDMQDMQATSNVLAAHRFSRNSQYNLVIPNLLGAGVPSVDDWSSADHTANQTVLEPGQSRPSRFPQGIKVRNVVVKDPSAVAFTIADDTGTTLVQWTGSDKNMQIRTPLRLYSPAGNLLLSFTGANSDAKWQTVLTVSAQTGQPAVIKIDPPTGGSAQIQFRHSSANSWLLYDNNSANFYIRDSVNSANLLELDPGAGVTGRALFGCLVRAGQTTTAGRPTGLNNTTDKGAKLFDTTLGKEILWNGTGWVDNAGASV